MTKKLFLIAMLITVVTVNSQSLKFGIKGGLNYSDISVVNPKASSKFGYHFGAMAELKINKFGIQPELMYSVLGAKFSGNVITTDANVGYLTLPVFLKFYFLKKFSIEAGPQVSYALSKSTDTSYGGVNLGEILEVNKFDYGFSAGGSFKPIEHLVIQVRGVYGVTQVTKETGIPEIDSFVIKNRAIQLSVGYIF